MTEKRRILEDSNEYLVEKLQEIPNIARIKLGLKGKFILGQDLVKDLEKKGKENGQI